MMLVSVSDAAAMGSRVARNGLVVESVVVERDSARDTICT